MARARSGQWKTALLLTGVTAFGLPLQAQNARPDNTDYEPEVYYIDGVEYRPYVPDTQRPKAPQAPAQAQPAQPQPQPQPQTAQPTPAPAAPVPSATAPETSPETTGTVASSAATSPAAPASPPPPPGKRLRYGSAIIQALDKITAETMRFEVKVGQSVRYKGLVFTVKACETSAPEEPMSDAMAYLEVRTSPAPSAAGVIPKPRQVFQGWSYASSPGMNPFEHPAYDAWVVTCRAPLPVTVAGKP